MKPVVQKDYPKSARLYQEASRYSPGGVSSNFRLKMHPFPLFFERAQGSRLYDVDGNEYVDYVLGMGPVILGHAHEAVNAAVAMSLGRGQLYAGQHEDEVRLAHVISELVPSAQMARFSSSGSEAVQAAIRLARAYTGRSRIVKFEGHYHGWFDNVFVSVQPCADEMGPVSSPRPVPMSLGQSESAYADLQVLSWNDLGAFQEAVETDGENIAAVIMEPILCNTSVILPGPGYLTEVRELCAEHGIVLIFDEIITGFRVGLGGAQELLGVRPDLSVFAKALANGFPISCLSGRREIMRLLAEKPVMHGGTFNSNVVSCAAALATLEVLRESDGAVYSRIQQLGAWLMDGLRSIASEAGYPLLVQGLPGVFHTSFADQAEIRDYRDYYRCSGPSQCQIVDALLEHGIRITGRGTWFLSAAHSERDIEHTLRAAKAALTSIPLQKEA